MMDTRAKVSRMQCEHPPIRLHSYWACGDDGTPRTVLVVSCLDCHAILHGRALTAEKFDERNERVILEESKTCTVYALESEGGDPEDATKKRQ